MPRWSLRVLCRAARGTVLLWIAACLLIAPAARANVARATSDGDRSTSLVAEQESVLRVDSEDLSFEVDPELARAKVTATYRFVNPSEAKRETEAAFVFVEGDAHLDPAPAITIDGRPATFQRVTDADQLRPQLEAWTAAHPAEAQKLVASGSPFTRWSEARNTSAQVDDALVVQAAEEAIPSAVSAMRQGFSKLSTSHRMTWLRFLLSAEPSSTRTVVVTYTQSAGLDFEKRVNTTFTYDYLLSPAKSWSRFGHLTIRVRAPRGLWLGASLPFRAEGDLYRAELDGLPTNELEFEIMSPDKLWFGITTSPGYWAFMVAFMAAFAAVVGGIIGRFTAKFRTSTASRVAIAFGVALATIGVEIGVAAVLSWLYPPRALGFGYSGPFGLIVATVGACVVATVVAVFVGKRTEQRAA